MLFINTFAKGNQYLSDSKQSEDNKKMGKDQKSNFFKKIITSVFLRNILLMAVIFIAIVWGVLFSLKIYTKHNDTIQVPNLKGLQAQDAEAIIASSDLKCEVVDSIYHKDGTPGAILEQIPKEDSQVKSGRTIYLTVQSTNEPLATAPDLEDTSQRQAEALLRSLGFSNVNIVKVPSEYEGLVLGLEYKDRNVVAGQKLPKGSYLTLKVGNGTGQELDESQPIEEAN